MRMKSIFFKDAAANQRLAFNAYDMARIDAADFIATGNKGALVMSKELMRCGREHSAKARAAMGIRDSDYLFS